MVEDVRSGQQTGLGRGWGRAKRKRIREQFLGETHRMTLTREHSLDQIYDITTL
jgi:hypothetical protein